jgi:formate dehydrogenase maturation protein FdhE
MGFSPDLVWLIGELASSPLAHHLQEQVMEKPGSSALFAFDGVERSRRPLFSWDRGYCPFCGSWPAFIESCRGERQLRCSYCALAWTLPSPRCVYCGNEREGFVVAAPEMGRRERRIELCATCGNYTKVLEVADMTPFPLLAIEDLASMDLDRAAMNRDYRRPELFDLDRIEPLKPTC